MIWITSPQGPVVCLPHCTLTPLNALPSMAAALPPCVHLPDPNQFALCSLFSISRAWSSPFTPPHLFFTPTVHGALPPTSTPPPPTPPHLSLPHPPPPPLPTLTSPSLTPLYVLLHGLWPPTPHPALAPHTPGPLGHSGRGGVQGLPDQPGLRYRQRCTGI